MVELLRPFLIALTNLQTKKRRMSFAREMSKLFIPHWNRQQHLRANKYCCLGE